MIYELCRALFTLIFKFIFRWQVTGLENLPKSGSFILASNHISLWDPPLMATAVPQKVHYMAKEELFRFPPFGRLIKQLGAFPVRRGAADRGALKAALAILNEGKVLGIFPEGTTKHQKGELGQAKPGLALIAAKSKVPVIPVAITGTNEVSSNFWSLPRFTLTFGRPLTIEPKAGRQELEAFGEELMGQIGHLITSTYDKKTS